MKNPNLFPDNAASRNGADRIRAHTPPPAQSVGATDNVDIAHAHNAMERAYKMPYEGGMGMPAAIGGPPEDKAPSEREKMYARGRAWRERNEEANNPDVQNLRGAGAVRGR